MKNLKIKRKDGMFLHASVVVSDPTVVVISVYRETGYGGLALESKSECIKLGEWLLKNADKLETTKEKK